MTPEAYFEWEEQQVDRHEYDNGVVTAMPGGTRKHSRVGTNLIVLLSQAVDGTTCQVHGPDLRIAVAPRRFVYPDVSVVCGDESFLDTRETTLVNPTLVVEVLSPSTALKDRGDKFEAYRAVDSIQEVVFVEPERRAVEVYRRGTPWTLHDPADGTVTLASVGAALGLEAIYAETGVAA